MEKSKYYTGVEGSVTIYNPQVNEGQTYAQVYVHNGDDLNYFNLIATGWMVKYLLIILVLTFDALQLIILDLIYIYICNYISQILLFKTLNIRVSKKTFEY